VVVLLLVLLMDGWLSADRGANDEHRLESGGMLATADSSVVEAARGLVAFTLREFEDLSSTSDRRYAAEGLRHVGAVLEALARRDTIGPPYAAVADELAMAAEELESERQTALEASIMRAAFMSAASATAALQKQRFPHLARAADEVLRAADRISSEQMLSTQRLRVEEFFVAASDALIAMTWRSL
jgi:hypothetical protein